MGWGGVTIVYCNVDLWLVIFVGRRSWGVHCGLL